LKIHSGDSSTIIIQKFNEKIISLRDYICDNVGFKLKQIFLCYNVQLKISNCKPF
jgi:hypothetical protein